MHVKRRRLPNFESCSVALFTSMALGGAALPARSQTSSTPPITSSSPTVPSTSSTVPSDTRGGPAAFRIGPTPRQHSTGATPGQNVSQQLAQTFKGADLNGDGQLGRQETSAWPTLTRSFDRIDRDKDGSI